MRNPMFRFRAGVCAVLISPLVVACASQRVAVRDTPSERAERATEARDLAAPPGEAEREMEEGPSALAVKLARSARFAPGAVTQVLDSPGSFAEQDWLEHSVDGGDNGPPPFTAFATARND